MKLQDFLSHKVSWLEDIGPHSDIVISSRIRLARNLCNYSFRGYASADQEIEFGEILKNVFLKNDYLKGALFIDLKSLNAVERFFLVERHLISKEHAEYEGYRSVIVSEGESISVMINEEDHIRMQLLLPGFQIMDCWRLADKIDSQIQKKTEFAYTKEWGYLTACPTNVGTGMRASVMMHLPCLVLTTQINKVLEAIAKLGLAVRGLYGEGTAATGDFFQISNQLTLGLSEEDIIDNIEKVCYQIIQHELDARNTLYKKEKDKLEDRIFRAYGLLKNVRIVNYTEAITLLSCIRLGMSLGIIKDVSRERLNELFLLTQPSHIQFLENKEMVALDRDIRRAQLIREKLV